MTFNIIISYSAALFCAGLAVFVFFKERRSFIHLAFSAGMVAFAAETWLNGLSLGAPSGAEIRDWQHLRLLASAFVPVGWLLFSLSFGRADYREMIRKWQWYLFALLVFPFALIAIFGGVIFEGRPVSDAASPWLIPLGWSGYLFYLFYLLGAVLIIMNLERTLRNSTGSILFQIKFMILGLAGIFAVRVYTGSQVLLFHSLEVPLEVINAGTLLIGSSLIILSLVRLRLLSVEIYPSHSFLYNSITVVIVGLYLVAVGVLSKLAGYFNISQFFLIEALFIFLACLGLAVILLSNKLRQEIKRFVNIHLKRPKYDYRKIWASFSHRTASLTTIKEVCAAVAKMVAETFGVACVTLWLLDESQENLLLGGSTVLSSGDTKGLAKDHKAVEETIRLMRNQEMPVDFDQGENDWIRGVKKANLKYFQDARIRYGVPLFSGNEFLGYMTLDEKITKEKFSLEDFDLLMTIADQAAGSILNIKISEFMGQKKEMESLQTMSAFVLHDLKNLASTLSLTMQNLPIYFDNPEFRNDAIRITQQSVNKINNICSGLSSLSQKIELTKVKADINRLAESTFAKINGGAKGSMVQNLKPVPNILMDPEQIQKVLTNLLINANEATGNEGEIMVASVC
jgi:putative PEP-CTERM system histidine kinase